MGVSQNPRSIRGKTQCPAPGPFGSPASPHRARGGAGGPQPKGPAKTLGWPGGQKRPKNHRRPGAPGPRQKGERKSGPPFPVGGETRKRRQPGGARGWSAKGTPLPAVGRPQTAGEPGEASSLGKGENRKAADASAARGKKFGRKSGEKKRRGEKGGRRGLRRGGEKGKGKSGRRQIFRRGLKGKNPANRKGKRRNQG